MFTGIIEDVGKINKISADFMTIETKLDDVKIGDSVSVNGICLTVKKITTFNKNYLIDFDFSPETSNLTTISFLKTGSSINLERALKASDRFGGHFLMGHVDCTGVIKKLSSSNNSKIIEISIINEFMKYIIQKGSVGIDGISLTLAKVYNKSFEVSIIPHTFENTSLKLKRVGSKVNIETDIMVKSVENILNKDKKNTAISNLLKENGFT
ncbi:riboflavin synthase [Elusimicrobiota bacterium]